ncbi:MAG: carbon storage regulator [Planctomycetaceae bacterium]|nr:carbon storage regulator [Planctomycetales bacterium]MCB9940025.1 carbon storage regulator [Planctomycetaceae bacterium]
MLTFTRKSGQSVVIQVAGHPPLTVTFLGSRPGKCQLAFDGPQEYHILREELTFRDSVATESIAFAASSLNRATTTPRIAAICAS